MNAALVFRHIRWALLGLVLMVAAGAASVLLANQLHARAMAEQRSAQASRADAQSKLSRAREEEQELRATAARHDELRRLGILGDERRLDWVERVRVLRETHRIPELRYEISPQQRLSTAPGGRYEFMASPMRLNLGLLHEEDLLRLLGDLPDGVAAHIRVRRCNLERLPAPAQPGSPNSPQLKADCELDWITVRDTSAGASR